MRDYVSIGPTPVDEPCAQLGRDSSERMLAECRAFARQLRRQFPAGDFGIKRFDHDFGAYYEVVAYYNPDDRSPAGIAAMEAAFEAENNTPLRWDKQARDEMRAWVYGKEVPSAGA